MDAALYNEAFAGRAKVIPRCRYCLADTHSSQECGHAPMGSSGDGAGHLGDGRASRTVARQM